MLTSHHFFLAGQGGFCLLRRGVYFYPKASRFSQALENTVTFMSDLAISRSQNCYVRFRVRVGQRLCDIVRGIACGRTLVYEKCVVQHVWEDSSIVLEFEKTMTRWLRQFLSASACG